MKEIYDILKQLDSQKVTVAHAYQEILKIVESGKGGNTYEVIERPGS